MANTVSSQDARILDSLNVCKTNKFNSIFTNSLQCCIRKNATFTECATYTIYKNVPLRKIIHRVAVQNPTNVTLLQSTVYSLHTPNPTQCVVNMALTFVMAVVAQSSVIRRVWIRAPQLFLYIIIIAIHICIYIRTFLSSSLNNIRNFHDSKGGSKDCTHSKVEARKPCE